MRLLIIGTSIAVLGAGAAVAIALSSKSNNKTATVPVGGRGAHSGGAPSSGGGPSPGGTATTAPAPPSPVTISSGPCEASACTTSSQSASFTFSALGAAAFECALDGGGFSPCTSPHTVDGVGDGTHSFQARVAGAQETVAGFDWTVSPDAVVNSTSVDHGVTTHTTGHACGGTHGDWTYKLAFRGNSVSGVYNLHWTFGPGSRSAPISGSAHIPPINGITVHITIRNGVLKATATSGGVTVTVTANVTARLAGTRQAPVLKFVQSNASGSVSGFGGLAPFGGAGGVSALPVSLRAFPGCP